MKKHTLMFNSTPYVKHQYPDVSKSSCKVTLVSVTHFSKLSLKPKHFQNKLKIGREDFPGLLTNSNSSYPSF